MIIIFNFITNSWKDKVFTDPRYVELWPAKELAEFGISLAGTALNVYVLSKGNGLVQPFEGITMLPYNRLEAGGSTLFDLFREAQSAFQGQELLLLTPAAGVLTPERVRYQIHAFNGTPTVSASAIHHNMHPAWCEALDFKEMKLVSYGFDALSVLFPEPDGMAEEEQAEEPDTVNKIEGSQFLEEAVCVDWSIVHARSQVESVGELIPCYYNTTNKPLIYHAAY